MRGRRLHAQQREVDQVRVAAQHGFFEREPVLAHRDELRLAQQVFNHTHEAIVICDTGLQVIRANPAFSDITGTTSKTLRNSKMWWDAGVVMSS